MNMQWLLQPEDVAVSALPPGQVLRHSLPLPAQVGSGWFEMSLLAQGMSVLRAVHHLIPQANGQWLDLSRNRSDFGELALSTQVMLRGRVGHREFYPPMTLIFEPGQVLCRHADGFDAMPFLDTSSDSEMVVLSVSDGTLGTLLGDDVAQSLIDKLGLTNPPQVRVLPLPLSVVAPLQHCLSPALTGAMRLLLSQAKALEYLCALATHLTTPVRVRSDAGNKRNLMVQLHEQLSALEGSIPTLDALARQYARSARWLNDEFTQTFGQSIYAFISGQRLAQAHAALQDTDIQIKVLAGRLGYAHVNHFGAAFKKKFGYPPGSLRRTDIRSANPDEALMNRAL